MTKVLKIPLEVLTEDDREELQRIIAESHYTSNHVVDCLLTDQQRKLDEYEGDE